MKPDMRKLSCGFSLLSDPTRLGILLLLAKGPKNVMALCEALRLKRPAVSYHLGLLRMGRLVNGIRRGGAVVYTTDMANLNVLVSALAKLTAKRA